MSCDEIFNTLRQKLDVLGYNQPLPLGAVSLVGALFEDLIKTTESLRDAKLQISNLLEEKTCWELGVEPYKCDNSRLLAECNALHLDIIKQREGFEGQICEYAKKIRNLESDKRCLEDHCVELESQIRELTLRYSDAKTLKSKKNGVNMSKKPFISTVKAGVLLPNPPQDHQHASKCSKCNNVVWTKHTGASMNSDIERLQNDMREKMDQVVLYKKKVEERDREIRRLNELLTGGRPPAALAKDCCYKNVGSLSEDVEKLQKEKIENIQAIREIQESMHEAKQRAVDLADKNKRLEKELRELKETALCVEQQANEEITKKECEISKLCEDIKRLKKQMSESVAGRSPDRSQRTVDEKRRLNERLNELTLREKDLETEIDRLIKKNVKLKNRIVALEAENEAKVSKQNKSVLTELDEERIRLKSERDLFQKEYLRLVEKSGSSMEVSYLRAQLKEKEDELNCLRAEKYQLRAQAALTNNEKCSPSSSISVQAAIIRGERERDVVKAELHCVKAERDLLREKLQFSTDAQLTETDRFSKEIQQLNMKICDLQKENRDLLSAQIPGQTHLTLMREEIEELKKRVMELQSENCRLNTSHNQLKILHEQTERALVEYQNKLAISETNLRNAESRLGAFSSNRDTARSEVYALRNEITVLKSTNNTLEQEKDKVMADLDLKTEKLYRLESEIKSCKRQKDELETTVRELQSRLGQVTVERKERETELHETSTESKTLRQQINTLKEIRDQAIAENSGLSNDLADAKAEICLTKRKLKDSEKEVERLKQKLQQYVQKVQKAEDLLMQKERERDEMLDHYRSLSHDAIVLEGNNQSLEMEAAEHKRQLLDAEAEVSRLKQELVIKNCTIEKLEKQVTVLSSQICSLEKDLEQSYDDQKLLKADLDAMKELCEKLDLQSDKQNAELQERGEIISKLEKENSEMRKQLSSSSTTDKAATDILQDLLAKSRQELESERTAMCKLAQEKLDLRKKLEEMQKRLEGEREKATQKEALAKEYSVQIQEMQHNLTDDRFQKARNREKTPRSSQYRLPSGLNSSPSQIDDIQGCARNARGLYSNRTYSVDSNTPSNMYSNDSSNVRCNINRNACELECRTDIPSSIYQNESTCEAHTSSSSIQRQRISSPNKCSNKNSAGRPKHDGSLKCVKTVLKAVSPCRRSNLVQDVKNFLKDSSFSYNEKVSFDEDKDDIIIRRTRNVKTSEGGLCKRSRDDSKEWAFLLTPVRILSKYVNSAWDTILSSTSRSSRCSPERRKEKNTNDCRSPTFRGVALKAKKSSEGVARNRCGEINLKLKEKSRSICNILIYKVTILKILLLYSDFFPVDIPTVPLKALKERKCTKPTPSKTKEFVDKPKSRENSPSRRSSKESKLEKMSLKIYQVKEATPLPSGLTIKQYVKKDPKQEIQDTINTTILQKQKESKVPLEINNNPKKSIELRQTKEALSPEEIKLQIPRDKKIGIPSRKYDFLSEKTKGESKTEMKPKENIKIENKLKKMEEEWEPDTKSKMNLKSERKPPILKQESKREVKSKLDPEVKAKPKKVEFKTERKPKVQVKSDEEQNKMKRKPLVQKIRKEKQNIETDLNTKIKAENKIKTEDIKEEDVDDEYFDVYGLAPGPRGYDDYDYGGYEPSTTATNMSTQTDPDTIEISDDAEDVKPYIKEEPEKLKKHIKLEKESSETKVAANKKEEEPELSLEKKQKRQETEKNLPKTPEISSDGLSATMPAEYELPNYGEFSPRATSSFEEEPAKSSPVTSESKSHTFSSEGKVMSPEQYLSQDQPPSTSYTREDQPSPSSSFDKVPPIASGISVRDQQPTSSYKVDKNAFKKISEKSPIAEDKIMKTPTDSATLVRIQSSVKRKKSPPPAFKGCGCMQPRYEKLRTLIYGSSSIPCLNKDAYYRRSIICKRSNNRIEQTLLLERGNSTTSHSLEFDTSVLPPPPEYNRCRKEK